MFHKILAMIASMVALSAAAQVAPPAVITMDGSYLEIARQRLATGDATLKPSLDKLLQDAAKTLALAPESVTHKKMTPPSGSKNDYMSLAPYWWPDPGKPDGLPYIQRDGEFNPSSKNGDTDSVRMQVLCMGTQNLSLAYYFTGDRRFAKKTAEFIRTWFLDPRTRMNPNLRFGQAVMGRVDGRGIGLIDTRNFWMVIDAALLIEPTGELSAQDMADLRKWFREFTDWMLTSDIGIDEFNAFNNHGTFYDMQVANYALFFGDMALAKKAVQRAVDLRIASQVAIDGKQHAELERTTPFHYSAFNLDAMTNIARYGEHVKVNVWKIRDKGRGLRTAATYLAAFAAKPETWPYKELHNRPETEVALGMLLKAERGLGGGSFAQAASQIPEKTLEAQEYIALYKAIDQPFPTTRNSVDRLVWPVK